MSTALFDTALVDTALLDTALFDTALGTCAVVWREQVIVRLLLPERSRSRLWARIAELGNVEEGNPPKPIRAAMRQVTRLLDGACVPRIDAPLDLSGFTPFTRKIYEALREVPAGETVSYGELAARAGSPKAARAVGRAMATNPMPLLIPCHRVIGKSGKPVGFTAYGGIATKAKLLAIEGVKLR